MAQLQSTVLVVSAAHVASPRCLLGTTLTPRAPHLRRAAAPVSLFNFGRKESDEEAAKEEPATDAEVKRLRAEKLQLQAELAELEAEKLSAGARQLAPPSASPPPLPPPAAVSPAPPSPAAPASVSESAAQLCVTLDGAVKAMGLESSEPLQRTVLQAWSEARVSQSAEIATLRRQLDSAVELEAAATPDEDQSFGEAMATVSLRFEETERSRRGETDANQLWLMAENRTGSRVERRARARALTKASFKFLATLTAYDETEEQAGEEGKVAVPGEGLISVAASRQRLRLLERHDAAECVEYRLFAAALSNEDGFEEASGAPLLLLEEEESTANVTGLLSKWASKAFGDDQWKEMMASEDMSDVDFNVNGTLSPWLEPLSDLLGRSTNLRLSPGDLLDIDDVIARTTLFPALLTALAGRQGNTEPLVVYLLARMLGRINVQALAQYEGRELGSKSADEVVAEQEATFVRKVQQEVINSVGVALAINLGLVFAIGSFVLWQVTSLLFGLLAPPPADPLSF